MDHGIQIFKLSTNIVQKDFIQLMKIILGAPNAIIMNQNANKHYQFFVLDILNLFLMVKVMKNVFALILINQE